MRCGRFTATVWLCLVVFGGGISHLRAQMASVPAESDTASSAASSISTTDKALPRLDEQADLGDYLAYAALESPALKGAFQRYQAALAQVPQARSLGEPQLSYQYFIKEVETRVGPQRQSLGLSQRFPWFGVLDLKGNAAEQAARAAAQQVEFAKLALFFTVKNAYFEYYYLAQAIAVTEENLALLGQLEQVLLTRYSTAVASHPAVVRVQVELGKLDDRLRTLHALRQPTAGRLNAALNRPIAADIPWPKEITISEMAFPDEEVLAVFRTTNPALKTLDARIEQQKRLIDLAQTDFYPDFTLGVNYVEVGDSSGGRHPADDGKDVLGAMLSINIPLWREKYQAGVRQARARYHGAVSDRLDEQNRLASELQLALFDFHDASRKIDLYANSLLPKAQEAFKVTQSAFLAGQSSFSDLIDAQRLLLEFQLALHRSRANHEQSLAKVEMLVGRDLTDTTNEDADTTDSVDAPRT